MFRHYQTRRDRCGELHHREQMAEVPPMAAPAAKDRPLVGRRLQFPSASTSAMAERGWSSSRGSGDASAISP
jgi:hypothetical protein